MAVNIVEFGKRTSLDHAARKSIERQAKEWLIRMDGDKPLSAAQKQALREWMSRSAFHAGELTRLARLWSRANVMTELLGAVESRRHEQKKASKLRKGRTHMSGWMRTTLMTASAVLSCVVLVYYGLR